MKSQLDMKSQLEETKQKIIELLVRHGFPKFGGVNIDPPDKIYVDSKRDDIPEGEGIKMTIRLRSGQRWSITMSDDDRLRGPQPFKDEEEMLEFIEKKLRDLVKCYG